MATEPIQDGSEFKLPNGRDTEVLHLTPEELWWVLNVDRFTNPSP